MRTGRDTDAPTLYTAPLTDSFAAREAGDDLTLEGYGVRWDSPTELYRYGDVSIFEQISSGTWDDDARSETVSLWAHDWRGAVFGNVRAGTMVVEDESEGLAVTVKLDGRQQAARDAWASIERGDTWGQSVGFSAGPGYKESREEREDGSVLYTVERSPRLYEVSVLWNPAYRDTTIDARQVEARRVLRGHLPSEAEAVKLKEPGRGSNERRARALRLRLALAAGRSGRRKQ